MPGVARARAAQTARREPAWAGGILPIQRLAWPSRRGSTAGHRTCAREVALLRDVSVFEAQAMDCLQQALSVLP